jgi:hypothetical protein
LLILPALVMVLCAPWLAWRAGLPAIDENYPQQLTLDKIESGLGKNAATILVYAVDRATPLELVRYRGLGGINGWTLFWPVLLTACAMFIGKCFQRNTAFLTILLCAHVLLYFAILLVTPWQIEELMFFITLRLLMHFSGVAVLLLVLLMERPGGARTGQWAAVPQ